MKTTPKPILTSFDSNPLLRTPSTATHNSQLKVSTPIGRSLSTSQLMTHPLDVFEILRNLVKLCSHDALMDNDELIDSISSSIEENEGTDCIEQIDNLFWVEYLQNEALARLFQSKYIICLGLKREEIASQLYLHNHSQAFKDYLNASLFEKIEILEQFKSYINEELITQIALATIEKLNGSNTILKDYHRKECIDYITHYQLVINNHPGFLQSTPTEELKQRFFKRGNNHDEAFLRRNDIFFCKHYSQFESRAMPQTIPTELARPKL